MLFRIIPYLNNEWNIVCHNPAEVIADDVQPMTLGELSEKLGYSASHVDKLKRDLCSIKTNDGKKVIGFTDFGEDKRTFKIIINPKVIFRGTDFNNVAGIAILAKEQVSPACPH
jgi:hypothetical protein